MSLYPQSYANAKPLPLFEQVFGDQPHIGTCRLEDMDDKAKWSWLSYRQVGNQSALLAAGLAGLVCG